MSSTPLDCISVEQAVTVDLGVGLSGEGDYKWSILSPQNSRKKSVSESPSSFPARRIHRSQSWRANAIDPDSLPPACEPCRCHRRHRGQSSGAKTSPYSLRQRPGTQRKLEDITQEEIAQDLCRRIAEIPVPGRRVPRYDNITHLSHELKLRLAMTAMVIEECRPEAGGEYSYHTVRPDSRVVEIQDAINEEGESEVTLRIRINNIKKAELWKLSNCQSK